MTRVAIVVTLFGLVFAVPAWSQTQNGDMPHQACLSSVESRDLFVADKLAQPFRVMQEAARSVKAEAIDIQLCRQQGALVYDVTLLDPQGRVFHRLVNATSGTPLTSPPPRPEPMARPPAPGPRPIPDDPGRDGDGFAGRRFRPDFFQGPRLGPYMYPGSRPNGRFFPGPRPGERVPAEME